MQKNEILELLNANDINISYNEPLVINGRVFTVIDHNITDNEPYDVIKDNKTGLLFKRIGYTVPYYFMYFNSEDKTKPKIIYNEWFSVVRKKMNIYSFDTIDRGNNHDKASLFA